MIWYIFCILLAQSTYFYNQTTVYGFLQRRMNKLNDTALGIMNTSRTVTNRDEALVTRGLRGKIVIILGPTATGKTDASIEVALKLKEHNIKAEIINTDSMQIYEGFDIGTAKPTTQQMETIKHHLIGFIPATQHYNVAQYVHTTTALIAQMHANNILPILVGGSNMYVEGLLWPSVMDMQMEETDDNDEYQGHSTLELYEKLRMLDPERAAELHMNDRKRITRSLDVVKRSGMKHSELIMMRRNEKNKSGPKYDSLMFAMLCETAEHKRRIKERSRKMLEDGILEECNQLVELIENEVLDTKRGICQSIAYKELIPILKNFKEKDNTAGVTLKEECATKLETATWQYARRQNTWIKNRFKKENLLKMVPIDTTDISQWNSAVVNTMENEIIRWYHTEINQKP